MALILKSSKGVSVSENMFVLEKDRYTIGREAQNDIFLNDIYVSRLHAEIYMDKRRKWYIHDIGSKNGTFLNGERLGSDPAFLSSGDIISIADKVEFVFGHPIINSLTTQVSTAPISPYGIEINKDTEDVFIDSVRISPKLSPKEFLMLSYIAANPDRICKYRELYAVVYSERPQPNSNNFDPNDVQPSLYIVADGLRKKLKRQNIVRPVFKARSRVGYQLVRKDEEEE